MLKSLIGGLAGALTVTLLHEYLKKIDKRAPRLDKLGEEATSKTVELLGGTPPEGDNLYRASMAADIVSNTLYYSSAGAHPTMPVLAGTGLGLFAGLGSVYMPEHMGLNPDHTAASDSRKWISIALYTVGGLVAGVVIKSLSKSK